MKKVVIAAMDRNRGIGFQNDLPWRKKQRADMKHFVDLTTGFPIIVGRKTYESFTKRPLPGRTNIVISHQPGTSGITVPSIDTALRLAEAEGKEMVFIVGGRTIYQQTEALADQLEITEIDHVFQCDSFFPEINPEFWKEIRRQSWPADEKNLYSYSFVNYERIRRS